MMEILNTSQIFDIIVGECRNGCTDAPNSYAYLMKHHGHRVNPTSLRRLVNSLNFAAIREEYPAVEGKLGISKGDTVRVLDPGATYNTYHNWPEIGHVPHFVCEDGGAMPEAGKAYLVTHVGKHECGFTLYVLDGQYIVDEGAFKEPLALGMPFFDY